MDNYWKGKKVLITGHTGFVGSWLTLVLRYMGADITGFSLEEEKGSLYGRIKGGLEINSIYGDLRNQEEIRNCIEECKPEIVFHIAAFGFVKECHEDPYRAYSTNVQGTLNLLGAIEKCDSVTRIIVASSDKVYHNTDSEAYLFKEDDPLGGSDAYSASKTCEDMLAQGFYGSYLKAQGKAVCIVRPSNILGGGDHNMTRLIPSIYDNLRKGLKPEIRNPDSVRPWQNIFDIVDAYLMLAERCNAGLSVYNVGPLPDGIKTVGEIADYVSRLYGVTAENTESDNINSIEKAYLGLSIEKIMKETGWKPKRGLDDTLREIYEFYKNEDGKNTYDLCMKQIRDYYE